MQRLLALAALMIASPVAAQAPIATCPTAKDVFCQLGPFYIETAWENVPFRLTQPSDWSISLYEHAIQFQLLLKPDAFQFFGADDGSPDILLQESLFFSIFNPTPGYRFFRTAIMASGAFDFAYPDAGASGALGTTMQVAGSTTGTGVGSVCQLSAAGGPNQRCQFQSSSRSLPFTSDTDPYLYGVVEIFGAMSNPGFQPIEVALTDISLVGTIYFDRLTPVPEPATLGLLALGLVGVGLVAWRRRG